MVALSRNHARVGPGTQHIAIAGHTFELAVDLNTGAPMWTQKKAPFSRNVVTPAAVPYLQGDPRYEVPRGFFNFRHGMGFKEENIRVDEDTFGYEHMLYGDSGNGYIENGPAVTSVTPNTTSAGVKFLELVVDTTRKLIAVTQRYVLVRDADSGAGWVVSRDFGGNVITDAAVFRGTGAPRTCLIVGIGTGAGLWTWDGTTNTTTWTQDVTADAATVFGQIREELWRAPNNYQISKTTDGGAAATWGAAFTACDRAITITAIEGFDNRLILGTDQGLYSPTATEDDVEELTPAFRYQRRAVNCVGMKTWWDSLYVPMGGSLFRYQADGGFPEIGLGTLQDNTSEVQGLPTALAGYNNWTLFAAFYNAIEDASYLLRWGNQQLFETDQGTERVFVPGWHGALYKWSGVTIKDMIVTEVPDGTPYLYLIDDDGVIHRIILPRFSMEWHGDTRCTCNTTNPCEVFLPRIYHGVPFEQKANLAIACMVENLTTSRYIDVTYRTTPTGTFGGEANIDNNGRFTSDPGERLNFVAPDASQMTQLKATLTTPTAATPAILRSIALYQSVRPTFKWIFTAGLVLGDHAQSMQGAPMLRYFNEADQFAALTAAAGSPTPVPIVTPRNETMDALITDLSVVPTARIGDGPLHWLGQIELVQHLVTSDLGEWGNVAGYTWGEIAPYTWEQVTNLE